MPTSIEGPETDVKVIIRIIMTVHEKREETHPIAGEKQDTLKRRRLLRYHHKVLIRISALTDA